MNLHRYARPINPLLRAVLARMQHYGVTTQSEYATNLVVHGVAGPCRSCSRWSSFTTSPS
jgi:hypothetical protein